MISPSSLYRRVGAVPRTLAVAVSLFFLAGLVDGVVMPFFGLWAEGEAGVPTGWVGVLLGCYAGGELLATPLLGGIADRVGRRRVLLVSTAGVGGGFLLLGAVHGTAAAAAVLLLIGGFESVLHPTAAAVVADLAAPGTLRRHYALTRTASAAGHVVGPALGAACAGGSLGLVFAVAGAAMLAGTALVTAGLTETAGADVGEGDDDDPAALLAVLRDRSLAGLLLPLAVLGLATSWVESVLPLYAVGAGTLTPAGVGWLFTGVGVVAAVFQLPLAGWSARLGGFAVVGVSGGIFVLAFGGLLLSAALPVLAVAALLAAVAGMLSGPLAQAIVAELARPGARATAMAALSVVQDLQDAAGPAIGVALFAAGSGLPWLVGVPVAAGASLMLAGRVRRHEGAGPPLP